MSLAATDRVRPGVLYRVAVVTEHPISPPEADERLRSAGVVPQVHPSLWEQDVGLESAIFGGPVVIWRFVAEFSNAESVAGAAERVMTGLDLFDARVDIGELDAGPLAQTGASRARSWWEGLSEGLRGLGAVGLALLAVGGYLVYRAVR